MPSIDVLIQSDIRLSSRARQVCAMYDCPPEEKQTLRWQAELPIEQREWNVGLIVGPSGCGKSTVARHLFPQQMQSFDARTWSGASMIDDMPANKTLDEIATMCAAVGFNTIPAWVRPYEVLSNGEKFRASVARSLLEEADPIVVDEFTSVVDRQVAQIASHAVQKAVRRANRRFVAVSCHYDIVDWLQPDWMFEPATRSFAWRSVQRRPTIDIEISRVSIQAWPMFAPYHYMSAELHRAAQCFGLWANGNLAAFAAVLHRPHPDNPRIKAISRQVTLPDWQGLGLAFTLAEAVGAAYTALGFDLRHYPAHPPFIKAFANSRNKCWQLKRKPGIMNAFGGGGLQARYSSFSRPCAVFQYVGQPMQALEAARFVAS